MAMPADNFDSPAELPVTALMDKDMTAKTLEPVVQLMIRSLISQSSPEAVRALLPIDIEVTFTLYSDGRRVSWATTPFANGEGAEEIDTSPSQKGAGGGCIDPSVELRATAPTVNSNDAPLSSE
jgi:hypothetical protein